MENTLASDKFYTQIKKIWDDKTDKEKIKEIESTLKVLNKKNCVVSGNLSIKEQAEKVFKELYENKGWQPNVWLKIHLGIKNGEDNLDLLLTHSKFKDVHLVFSGDNVETTYYTFDHKLFHFEGKDEDNQVVYIKKQDLKPLSFSSFENWSEKFKELYREYLGLEKGFDKKVETTTVKVKKKVVPQECYLENFTCLGKIIVNIPESSSSIGLASDGMEVKREASHVFKFHIPEEHIILNDLRKANESIQFKVDAMSSEIDKLVSSNFYEFQDPFIRDFWFLLKPRKKVELVKHAHNNNISLESATRLYRDVISSL